MGECAATGAVMQCSFGMAPAVLNALPLARVMIEGRPAAVVTSTAANVNIPPFAMCTSLMNPSVAAATSAALGVLTPMPCMPAVVGPWLPGSLTMRLGPDYVLTSGSTCHCAWGGVITLTTTGTIRTSAT